MKVFRRKTLAKKLESICRELEAIRDQVERKSAEQAACYPCDAGALGDASENLREAVMMIRADVITNLGA